MKLKSSIITVTVTAALPYVAALFAAGRLSDNYLGAAILIYAVFILRIVFFPSRMKKKYPKIYLIHDGCVLLKSYFAALVFHILLFVMLKTFLKIAFFPSLVFILTSIAADFLLILGGSVRILISSTQISITKRVLLITLWWFPIVNLFVIRPAEKTAWLEFERESARIELDNTRAENEICRTKYPILLVHGIFFRDLNFFNYWGRIPKELIKNGATIYYGRQKSAAGVEECGFELKNKIEEIINITGCEKVNIIAHSKGGLDSRYAASIPGMSEKIASITTINTPHKGCEYADFLIERLPSAFLKMLAVRYNSALAKFGESDSDFAAGIYDLTAARCSKLNAELPLPDGVFCQSCGSHMKKVSSAGFPLNFGYIIAKIFSSNPNDGLVDIDSMNWGSRFILFTPKTKRGISHGDVIDLFREDIKGFDVREEYVKIAADLKSMGL